MSNIPYSELINRFKHGRPTSEEERSLVKINDNIVRPAEKLKVVQKPNRWDNTIDSELDGMIEEEIKNLQYEIRRSGEDGLRDDFSYKMNPGPKLRSPNRLNRSNELNRNKARKNEINDFGDSINLDLDLPKFRFSNLLGNDNDQRRKPNKPTDLLRLSDETLGSIRFKGLLDPNLKLDGNPLAPLNPTMHDLEKNIHDLLHSLGISGSEVKGDGPDTIPELSNKVQSDMFDFMTKFDNHDVQLANDNQKKRDELMKEIGRKEQIEKQIFEPEIIPSPMMMMMDYPMEMHYEHKIPLTNEADFNHFERIQPSIHSAAEKLGLGDRMRKLDALYQDAMQYDGSSDYYPTDVHPSSPMRLSIIEEAPMDRTTYNESRMDRERHVHFMPSELNDPPHLPFQGTHPILPYNPYPPPRLGYNPRPDLIPTYYNPHAPALLADPEEFIDPDKIHFYDKNALYYDPAIDEYLVDTRKIWNPFPQFVHENILSAAKGITSVLNSAMDVLDHQLNPSASLPPTVPPTAPAPPDTTTVPPPTSTPSGDLAIDLVGDLLSYEEIREIGMQGTEKMIREGKLIKADTKMSVSEHLQELDKVLGPDLDCFDFKKFGRFEPPFVPPNTLKNRGQSNLPLETQYLYPQSNPDPDARTMPYPWDTRVNYLPWEMRKKNERTDTNRPVFVQGSTDRELYMSEFGYPASRPLQSYSSQPQPVRPIYNQGSRGDRRSEVDDRAAPSAPTLPMMVKINTTPSAYYPTGRMEVPGVNSSVINYSPSPDYIFNKPDMMIQSVGSQDRILPRPTEGSARINLKQQQQQLLKKSETNNGDMDIQSNLFNRYKSFDHQNLSIPKLNDNKYQRETFLNQMKSLRQQYSV